MRDMIREEEVFQIGKLGKTHGVKGEISFLFDDDVFDRVDADYLILKIDGILVPFFIEEYRFKSDSNALMKFEGIDTQEQARDLTGTDVYFPRRLADSGRTVGRIASVDDSTLNILFCLDDGRLIPASEDLIIAVDQQPRSLTMHIPAGLLEL